MVYQIRNKGFHVFNTALNPRLFFAPKTFLKYDLKKVVTIQVQSTRYSGMRIKQNYRLISRASKQFLMGDKLLETITILTLKDHWF